MRLLRELSFQWVGIVFYWFYGHPSEHIVDTTIRLF
jgi:hypothetical protein